METSAKNVDYGEKKKIVPLFIKLQNSMAAALISNIILTIRHLTI